MLASLLRAARRWCVMAGPLWVLVALGACQPRNRAAITPTPAEPEGADVAGGAADTHGERARASRRAAAGATCSGRDDCTSDQVCVDSRCRYRATSVAGEVLASAAEAQIAVGDWEGAIETYDQAFEAFSELDAPVPPEIACGAAHAILSTATDEAARERGARTADHCFRTTVPGDPARASVRRALARLRFEGLDIDLFDQDEPADHFFDDEHATRPTVDAVVVELQMPDIEARGTSHDSIRALLQTEPANRAVADCFLQDWEVHHARSATAQVRLSFDTELRDMGDYDVYEPHLEIAQVTAAQDGFEPCLAASLPSLMEQEGNRSMRGEWTQTVRFTANVQ